MLKTIMCDKISLINRFPRQLGRPFKEQIAYDLNDVNNYILRYGSSYGVHISVYSFSTIDKGKIDYESAVIDKIFNDIDDVYWLRDMRRLFKWCNKHNIICRFNMSGKGGHFFIFCKEQITNKRNTIFNFQSFLEQKLKIRIDPQVKGDLARSFRIPNTFNHRRQRYDIYMDEDLLFNHTEKEIYEIAEKFPLYEPKQIWYGNNLADLSDFDTESYMYGTELPTQVNGDLLEGDEIKNLDLPIDKFPPCVRSWLTNKDLHHKGRFCLVLYLRDQTITEIPYTFKEILSILKNTLNEQRWIHASTDIRLPGFGIPENLKPIKKAFSNTNYKMYSCYQLRSLHLCPERCGRWHPIYD